MENLASKLFIIFSVVGVLDAIYTAYEYATAEFGICYVNQRINCIDVFKSGHTSLFGIPFYAMGLFWFPLILILGVVITHGGKWRLRAEILLPILMIGNLFTLYLWYLELAVIDAICPFCVSLYVVNYALTAFVLWDVLT